MFTVRCHDGASVGSLEGDPRHGFSRSATRKLRLDDMVSTMLPERADGTTRRPDIHRGIVAGCPHDNVRINRDPCLQDPAQDIVTIAPEHLCAKLGCVPRDPIIFRRYGRRYHDRPYGGAAQTGNTVTCLLYTSPSPRDRG